jgi:glucose-1-phosphate thymidylyltransferase
MKGIILAGGRATRLYPLTLVISKQLLPVYDKPMVYYPLSMLMLAGIREVLVISTPDDMPNFQRLLKDGSQWGMRFSYQVQDKPRGLADAFRVGRDFIGSDPICLILGDNIFFGHGLPGVLRGLAQTVERDGGGAIFAYPVRDPERYGVIEFDENGKALSLEEKPQQPRSNYAVPGMYFYDNQVVEIAQQIQPSARGEIEITDVNLAYMRQGRLLVQELGRGVAWIDAGTHDSLLQAAGFIQAIEERQGMMISSPEEIAYRMGFIDMDQFTVLVKQLGSSSYQSRLEAVVKGSK